MLQVFISMIIRKPKRINLISVKSLLLKWSNLPLMI